MLDQALSAFVTLFVTIDPPGLAPLFLGITAGMSRSQRRRIGMRASLISREVIADSIELMVHAHDFDAVLCLVGCDKTVPAALMASLVNRFFGREPGVEGMTADGLAAAGELIAYFMKLVATREAASWTRRATAARRSCAARCRS